MIGKESHQSDSPVAKRYDALAAAERIPEMVERIVREFDPQKIILFGSHARGDANRWSDIDLLVVFDEPVDKFETAVEMRLMLQPFFVAKDIIITDVEELSRRGERIGNIFRPALREGRVLHERT